MPSFIACGLPKLFNTLFVKVGGMRKKNKIREGRRRLKKERGKEDKKYPTMPHVIFSYYRCGKRGEKGKHFLLILIIFNKIACHLATAARQRALFFTTIMSTRPN